jgi:hypothetical protein
MSLHETEHNTHGILDLDAVAEDDRAEHNLVRAPFTSPHRVHDFSCCGVELAGRRPG